jgi:hypothetical protein
MSPTLALKIRVKTIFPIVTKVVKNPIHISRYIIAYTIMAMGEIIEANAPEANITACFFGDILLNDALSIFMPKTGNILARDEMMGKFSFVRLDLPIK